MPLRPDLADQLRLGRGMLNLWKLEDHGIINQAHRHVVLPRTAFGQLEIETTDGAGSGTAAADSSSVLLPSTLPRIGGGRPLCRFPAAHLRTHLVKKVQRTRHLGDLKLIYSMPAKEPALDARSGHRLPNGGTALR